ncbi:MAG TPA: DUF5615 family PIN-like protein [Candidatus Angelobacter sp.]|nr:DUF5615 family PIN-like protein [Candidatus Angelobacter sp.]
MKLLFDHNLSHKLISRLADIYPLSTQTRLLNFSTANDETDRNVLNQILPRAFWKSGLEPIRRAGSPLHIDRSRLAT